MEFIFDNPINNWASLGNKFFALKAYHFIFKDWNAMPIKADLDETDWKILKELQDDGRMSNVELAAKIGISAPPCLRRVRRLEQLGIIKGYSALLSGKILGQDLVAFCSVSLHHQAESDLKAFAERANEWPFVRKAWMVSGESDFLLYCIAPDLSSFQTFVIECLTAAPNVDGVRTALTIKAVKDDPLLIL